MKTYVQLSEDRQKVWSLLEYDPDAMRPLSELFEPRIVTLLVDVTDLEVKPECGWDYDEVNFTPPPAPVLSKEQMLDRLEKMKQDYIEAHYPTPAREWLLAYPQGPAATQAGKDRVTLAWNWVNQVLAYMFQLMDLVNNGAAWDDLQVNFSQFDAADPQVTVLELLNAG